MAAVIAKSIEVPVRFRLGVAPTEVVTMSIIAKGDSETRFEDEEVASANDECRCQLFEASHYQYELDKSLKLDVQDGDICDISSLKNQNHQGSINTGNYVGRVSRRILDGAGNVVADVEFEVCSKKIDYRVEYRQMMKDIAESCAELLMLHDAPVAQSFDINPEADYKTIYEQFAFVSSIVRGEEFGSAVMRICSSPLNRLVDAYVEIPVTCGGRLSSSEVRQFASSPNRVKLPRGTLGGYSHDTVPRVILVKGREQTVDTPENRFVRYVLESFADFCWQVYGHKNAKDGLRKEVEQTQDVLDRLLSEPLFRSVSRLERVPISSPVLQRREGYREVLRSWMMFECAAKLIWDGGESVYSAGKRNAATLYEYWLFFKLREVIFKVFKIAPGEDKNLFKLEEKDGESYLNLVLRNGVHLTQEGTLDNGRRFHVEFSYNRVFNHNDDRAAPGSWTIGMRPDYTISIWPGELADLNQAEAMEAAVHLHFDAKYRVWKSGEQISDVDLIGEEDSVASTNAVGVYKSEDILKMHAYNEAIRRTYGSYVLYPGTERKDIRKYHEILPGIGAFAVRPNGNAAGDLSVIETFIRDVVANLSSRVTQREQAALHRYRIYGQRPIRDGVAMTIKLKDVLSDYQKVHDGLPLIPSETAVLVGFCKRENLAWVERSRVYNFRFDKDRRGALSVGQNEIEARFLLLHCEDAGDEYEPRLYRLQSSRQVMTRAELQSDYGYRVDNPPKSLTDKFWVVNVEDRIDDLPLEAWNLPAYQKHLPFVVTLADVIRDYGVLSALKSYWGFCAALDQASAITAVVRQANSLDPEAALVAVGMCVRNNTLQSHATDIIKWAKCAIEDCEEVFQKFLLGVAYRLVFVENGCVSQGMNLYVALAAEGCSEISRAANHVMGLAAAFSLGLQKVDYERSYRCLKRAAGRSRKNLHPALADLNQYFDEKGRFKYRGPQPDLKALFSGQGAHADENVVAEMLLRYLKERKNRGAENAAQEYQQFKAMV